MNKIKIAISEQELEELLDGGSFDWTYSVHGKPVKVHICREEE